MRTPLKLLSKLPTKRNKIITVDNIFEPDANIMDNFTLFEHLYNSEKQALEPYYIINKKSPYYEELKKKYDKHIIPWEGHCNFKFWFRMVTLMPGLKYISDSFQAITAFELKLNKIVKRSPFIFSIFTQHGVNYFKPDFINRDTYGFNIFDKVMVANDIEKELFLTKGGFSEENIIKNGLFRWDKIKNSSDGQQEKTIFVFFTKRDYFDKTEDLKNCTYVKTIIDILKDDKLQEVVKLNNIKLKTGLHHTISSKLQNYFTDNGIEIVSEENIAEIKQEASLLLTDYSSMCFEFFLQNKPVVFYNIEDSKECNSNDSLTDVAEPYKNKTEELFNIAPDKETAVNLMINYIKNNFICEKDITEKQDKFFYYKKDFCERFENYLISHLNDKK